MLNPKSTFALFLTLSTVPSQASPSPLHGSDAAPIVHTPAFTVRGTTWPNTSSVNFFGNIPYAEPPIGELRWRPPVTKAPIPGVINGSWFGPSCIQYSSGEETVYTEYLKGFLISPGQETSEGTYKVKKSAGFGGVLMRFFRLFDG